LNFAAPSARFPACRQKHKKLDGSRHRLPINNNFQLSLAREVWICYFTGRGP